jgi:hypothetical protein
LPTRNDGIVLLTTYIRETHPDFPILDPKGLFAALEALYECSTIQAEGTFHNDWPFSVQDFRWNGQSPLSSTVAGKSVPLAVVAFVIFMIFNVAAIVKVRARNYEFPPAKFYRAALLFSGDCFSQISVSSIQAIVMLIIHSILTPAEVNLWTLVHIAMAQVVELGLHREPQSADAGEQSVQQIHRFVFYVIYSLDRFVSVVRCIVPFSLFADLSQPYKADHLDFGTRHLMSKSRKKMILSSISMMNKSQHISRQMY